jgi:hypothetical protein
MHVGRDYALEINQLARSMVKNKLVKMKRAKV